ncbi:MAG: HAAS signaling domain-containing protein [Planctomycetota bacterium]|jgi:hypothetical protein
MTRKVEEVVHLWLDEAATAMGGDAAHRGDVLLELETTIYDRIEERTATGQIPAEAVRDVLDAMGDPAEVASSFVPVRPLVAIHQTRPFLVNLVVIFAVHFLLVIGASVAGQELAVPPLRITPIENAKNVLELLARALDTLLFDAGLLLCLFAVVPRLTRIFRFPRAALTVRPKVRRCYEISCFLALVFMVLNFFRDTLLAIYIPSESGTAIIPLVGPGIAENLLFFNAWILLAIGRELAYANFGESKRTLWLDIASNAAGLFCLLRIVATKHLVDLSPAREALGAATDGFTAVLNTTFTLLALAAAAMLAARVVRRALRLTLLHD